MADGVPLPTDRDAAPQPGDAVPARQKVPLDKPAASPGPDGGSTGSGVPADGSADAPASADSAGLSAPAGSAAPAAHDPWAAPTGTAAPSPTPAAPPSVHDQVTVTSLPGVDVSTPAPHGTGAPTPPPATTPQPWAGPSAFAPPGGPRPAMSSAPTPNPFAAPAPEASFPPPGAGATGAPVPPPPISPEGPGHIPYGYPQYSGYPGYPGGHVHPGVGYPAPAHAWPVMAPPPSNGMGIAAMVLGICAAALFCLWPLAIPLGVTAVIFGFVGRAKVRRGEATNPGHALAGIICGAVGILVGVGFLVLIIVAPGGGGHDSDPDPFYDGYSTSLSLVLPTEGSTPAALT
ncbi:DUF4190 domain-containing protein [Streptomyces sp. TG1A-60]|uniref:DUF4190 domain-containing protein n=1 Tax=Streptomyces sp. TG1A-60 TaxID=3129111 RepID=UPI0030D5FCB1